MDLFIKRGLKYIFFAFLIAADLCPSRAFSQKDGFPAQELETLDGGRTVLKPDSSARYTVLDFWALWCSPCLAVLPEIDNLAQRLEKRPVRFVLINCDNTRSRAKVRSYIRSKGLRAGVLLDPSQGLLRYYGISSLPHLLVLDSAGNVVDRKTGYMSGDELLLEEKLLKLLDK